MKIFRKERNYVNPDTLFCNKLFQLSVQKAQELYYSFRVKTFYLSKDFFCETEGELFYFFPSHVPRVTRKATGRQFSSIVCLFQLNFRISLQKWFRFKSIWESAFSFFYLRELSWDRTIEERIGTENNFIFQLNEVKWLVWMIICHKQKGQRAFEDVSSQMKQQEWLFASCGGAYDKIKKYGFKAVRVNRCLTWRRNRKM